jgi:hypothetical protein
VAWIESVVERGKLLDMDHESTPTQPGRKRGRRKKKKKESAGSREDGERKVIRISIQLATHLETGAKAILRKVIPCPAIQGPRVSWTMFVNKGVMPGEMTTY